MSIALALLVWRYYHAIQVLAYLNLFKNLAKLVETATSRQVNCQMLDLVENAFLEVESEVVGAVCIGGEV